MKNLRKCQVCKKQKARVLYNGRFVDTSHNEWPDNRTCPECSPKRYLKGSCKGCGKSYSIHFQGKEYCSKKCMLEVNNE